MPVLLIYQVGIELESMAVSQPRNVHLCTKTDQKKLLAKKKNSKRSSVLLLRLVFFFSERTLFIKYTQDDNRTRFCQSIAMCSAQYEPIWLCTRKFGKLKLTKNLGKLARLGHF